MSSEQHASKLPIKSRYDWNELNRAKEAVTFFEAVIQPSLERDGISPTVIDSIKVSYYRDILNIITQKLAQTYASINIETAVKIIDEELPKLLKESSPSVDIRGIINAWDFVKKVLTGGDKGEQTAKGSNSSSSNK
uniref:Hypothetical PepG protein n=1 Tax=Acidianus ambivalens TaxID=2283 RepID=O57696_ACIAM|nr:hypothetical protein [Acidianus ambivalens]CAA12519.1 hypothetical PepG protein [Acidianus ambivalens]